MQIPGAEAESMAQCHGRRSVEGDLQAPHAVPDRVSVPGSGKVPLVLQEQTSLGQ